MRPRASCALPVPTPGADDVYSAMRAGWTFPIMYQKDDRPDLGGAVGQRLRCAARVLLRRPDSRRDRRGRCWPLGPRAHVPHAVDRSGLPGAGVGSCLVRQQQAQAGARDRRAVAAGGGREHRHARREERGRAAGRGHRRPLRRGRRRFRRQGPHHLSALCRAGRPVFAEPAGAARQRSLRPVPVRHQASCADGEEPHGRGSRERPHAGVRLRSGPRRRRPRQSLSPRWRSSARPPRSASTTFPRSTSPRWCGIRAPSPPARCAASARCRP